MTVATQRIPQQVEGRMFCAQLFALEHSYCQSTDVARDFLAQGHASLEIARSLYSISYHAYISGEIFTKFSLLLHEPRRFP